VVLGRDVQLLENFLMTNWKEFIGTPLPNVIQVVPITSCVYEYGNDLILIFTDRCMYPAYVMKVSRLPSYSFKLKREFSSLRSLHHINKLKSLIPTPHYIGSLAQNTFFIQKGFPGSNLSKLIGYYGLNTINQQLLIEAVDILVAINTAPVDRHGKESCDCGTSGDTFKLFEKEYIAAGISKKKLEELNEYHKSWVEKGSSFFLHGDYWLTNLIVNDQSNRISGIIDWEFSAPDAPFPTDIILFIIGIGRFLSLRLDSNKSLLDSYKWTFFTKRDRLEFLKSYYQRYMNRMGIDRNSFIMLLELTLAEMAM
jgi:aminoglycoside phosphotransferase (APT) family kinase protein